MRLSPLVPPVGDPILPRLARGDASFDWTFGGDYRPIFVNSGTSALRLAIEVALLHSGRRGTVWAPAYGCPDIMSACLATDAEPVWYDISSTVPFLAPGQQPPHEMVAAIAVHFLGLVHPVDEIRAIALRSKALLIEDSAQRFPMPGEALYGDAVVLSFGRGKPVSLMEGGCLLIKQHLQPLAAEIASHYRQDDAGLRGQIKRYLHDCAIRPRIYGKIRHLPGLGIGDVQFRPAPPPARLGPRLESLAGRAALAYQSEGSWRRRQEATAQYATEHFPELRAIATCVGQTNRRLLRMPFLTTNAEAARDVCRRALSLGLEANRMYRFAQPFVPNMPTSIGGAFTQAVAFSECLLAIPILNRNFFHR